MAMSDEAMFAPPQGITIEAVNEMLAERLAQKHGKALIHAPSSRCRRRSARYNLLNCMSAGFHYRYHDDGSDVTATRYISGRDGR